jgi:hypothetical protein
MAGSTESVFGHSGSSTNQPLARIIVRSVQFVLGDIPHACEFIHFIRGADYARQRHRLQVLSDWDGLHTCLETPMWLC